MNSREIREPDTLSAEEVRLMRRKLRQLQWQPEILLREAAQIAGACRFRRAVAGRQSDR